MSLELYLLAYTLTAYWDVLGILQQVSRNSGLQQVVLPMLVGFVQCTLSSMVSHSSLCNRCAEKYC
jgi:hypothetical protein